MIVRRIRWRGYRVPFREPFVTAHAVLTAREGLLVTVGTDEGTVGLGEVAPLPGFGGTVADALRVLPRVAAQLVGKQIEGDTPGGALPALATALPTPFEAGEAAVRCGLEAALLDAWARERGCSLAELLAADGGVGAAGTPRARGGPAFGGSHPPSVATNQGWAQRPAPTPVVAHCLAPTTRRSHPRTIPVNATISAVGPEDAAGRAAAAVDAGFGTIKLKATAASNPTMEAARLAAVRAAAGPEVRLRLDANGAWTVDQAIAILCACAPYGLELVEQPVAADDVDGLRRVKQAVPVVVAADEAATDRSAVQRLLDVEAVGAIIIKPMAAGGLLESLALARLAREAGVLTVVTSTLETGVGVAAAAHLAAVLPGPLPACGLATAGLLASDLLASPLALDGGALRMPEGPGLGVALNEEAVARYATATLGGVEASE